jgi:hypothetical protein
MDHDEISEIIEDAFKTVDALIKKQNVDYEINSSKKSGNIEYVDGNLIHFHESSSTINLHKDLNSRTYKISKLDDGAEIPDDILEFNISDDPAVRVNTSDNHVKVIALAIIKEGIKKSKAQLEIENNVKQKKKQKNKR